MLTECYRSIDRCEKCEWYGALLLMFESSDGLEVREHWALRHYSNRRQLTSKNGGSPKITVTVWNRVSTLCNVVDILPLTFVCLFICFLLSSYFLRQGEFESIKTIGGFVGARESATKYTVSNRHTRSKSKY